jgi:hypothetical protein
METVEVNGVACWYKLVEAGPFMETRKRLGHVDMCPLCREQIHGSGHIYMILTNNVLFPNILCHDACVDAHEIAKAIRLMAAEYKEAKIAIADAKARMSPWSKG